MLTNTFLSQELNVDSLLQPLQLGGGCMMSFWFYFY